MAWPAAWLAKVGAILITSAASAMATAIRRALRMKRRCGTAALLGYAMSCHGMERILGVRRWRIADGSRDWPRDQANGVAGDPPIPPEAASSLGLRPMGKFGPRVRNEGAWPSDRD